MKITGIVVEYNPLHNGHLHHIKETKEKSECDLLIAVMSGNFVQRGEPALLNKHLRTKLALLAGVDLVVELPYLYAVQNADLFSLGAIKILNELGVDEIYFGSETNDVNHLKDVASIIDTKPFNEYVNDFMKQGCSYPEATHIALQQLTKLNEPFHPNDILGIQYIRQIKNINSKINYNTIKRVHSHYHDETITHEKIASATSIRKRVLSNESIIPYVPDYTYNTLKNHKTVTWDDFFPFLKYQIITSGDKLASIHDINEGFHNAILKHIEKTKSFEDLVSTLVSKRYTKSKVQRIMCHILNHITKDLVNNIDKGPEYIRILGFNESKSQIIKAINKQTSIPIITNIDKLHYPLLKLDEKINRIYHLVDLNKSKKIPIILNP